MSLLSGIKMTRFLDFHFEIYPWSHTLVEDEVHISSYFLQFTNASEICRATCNNDDPA